MSWAEPDFVSFNDIVLAYRKAKKEAYWDTNCANGFAFLRYEADLFQNLRELYEALNKKRPTWYTSSDFLGSCTYLPKGLGASDNGEKTVHFIESEPLADWERRSRKKKPKAEFRQIIEPTVDYLVVSALWIIKVGHKYDAILDDHCVYGNRVKRSFGRSSGSNDSAPNLDSFFLFDFYPKRYGDWKSDQLNAIRNALERDEEIVAISLDIKKYYHHIDPWFLLDDKFLEATELNLSPDDRKFTKHLIKSIEVWRDSVPDGDEPDLGLPVGITYAAVIANALLFELDSQIREGLIPIYYGRYVDDLFIVIKPGKRFDDVEDVINWVTNRIECLKSSDPKAGVGHDNLRAEVSYSPKSRVEFGADKQRIFCLEGKTGLDVIQPVEDLIRRQKSEHRLLPDVPDDEATMAGKALLVTRDGGLEADVLRKADVVSIRRFGFANLLSDLDDYSFHLKDSAWTKKRQEFYGLALRHLASPQGIFDFSKYIPRVLGLMVACEDWDDGFRLLDRLVLVQDSIQNNAEVEDQNQAKGCWQNLAKLMLLAALASGLGRASRKAYRSLIYRLASLAGMNGFTDTRSLETVLGDLAYLDWSRIAFCQLWLEREEPKRPVEDIPFDDSTADALHLGTIKSFCTDADNRPFHWRPLSFPTRPIPVGEISRVANFLRLEETFPKYCEALRGVKVGKQHYPQVNGNDGIFTLGEFSPHPVWVAVTSLKTSDSEFQASLLLAPQLSQRRYENLHRLLNGIAEARTRQDSTRQDVDYVALPELSLPRAWSRRLAQRLSKCGISLVAGLEYEPIFGKDGELKGFKNQALVSLTASKYLGGNLMFEQNKLAPAWKEDPLIREIAGVSLSGAGLDALKTSLPVYRHNGFAFGVLLCSDLTCIQARERFQGELDALFVPEWNSDLDTFDALVESGALDIHAYVIQANNRSYGDSRIRAPFKKDFRRDVVRLKGGEYDYFVIGCIDFWPLRKFQSTAAPDGDEKAFFKPFPIGFDIAEWRKVPRPRR